MYKCEKCGSESNEPDCGEWCETCNDLREKVIPPKREYTGELIFEKYLDDKCPVCDSYKSYDDSNGHTEHGGKCMALYFHCNECHSEYTVGYNRSRMPIESEITFNGIYKEI